MPGVTAWPTVQETHVDPRPFSLSVASTAGGPSTGEIWSPDLPWAGAPGGDGVVLPALTVGSVLVTATFLVAWNRVIDPSSTSLWSTERLSGPTRASLAFAGLGLASLGGWLLRGGARSGPLLYFGGIGLFAAVLVSLLLPARTMPPVVAEGLHKALVSTAEGHPGTDGVPRTTVYYPGPDATDPLEVRVSTSEREALAGPDRTGSGSDGTFRSRPSGAVLYEAFRSEATADVATESETFAWQLCQGLTDWFELVSSATPAIEDTGGMTFHVAESSVPDVEMFDHPVVSFLGVALACKRERPVITTVEPGDTAAGEYRISIHPFTADSVEAPILNSAARDGSHDETLNR